MQSRKPQVIVLTRVSTEEQDLERQLDAKNAIIRHSQLEQIQHEALIISGTVVLRTTEYKNAMDTMHRPTCDGMVVPALDRWFRLKMKLLSEWGTQLAEYVKPFEVLSPDGKTAKLIYTTLTASDGSQEFYALDLRNPKHQEILLEAVKYATKERVVIANRFGQGKDSARMNPEMKVDELPNGVEFVPYPGESRYDNNGRRKTRIKGFFRYNEFAFRVAKPILEKYADGAMPFKLWKEYRPLAAEIVSRLGSVSGKRNTGLGDVECVRHILMNKWWLGIKHRTKRTTREFNEATQKYESKCTERTDEDGRYEIETNLAGWVNPDRPFDPSIPREPLIDSDLFERIKKRLAEGSVEYGTRKKHDLDHLAHPLFHCTKCGTIMYPVQGSKNDSKNRRDDTYICGKRRRFRVEACNEPVYNMKKLDDEVALEAMLYLQDPDFVSEKLQEVLNQDRSKELQAEVDRKQMVVSDIEKRLNRLRKLAEETDDDGIGVRMNALRVDLRKASNAVFTAQAALDSQPNFDVAQMTQIITDDMRGFAEKPRQEQKELLAKYIPKITATQNDRTDRYKVKLDVKITAPAVREYEYEPLKVKPVPPSDGQPILVKHTGYSGYTGNGVSFKRVKSKRPCSVW